ncbi:MAG: RNA polymerase subunit sigma-24 [Thermodesulfovibrio sp.]|nr:RNA polymerase subunit sigma-24 [Thermodesulfovibrio sp.]
MNTIHTEVDREFQDIYNAFYDKIRRYLTRLVGESEAEDLTQEVFLKASRALHRFEGKSQVSTWLFRIATNTALDRLRNKSGRNTVLGDDLYDSTEEAEWAVEQAASPEQAVIQKEMNHCIRNVVETLPENYRVALSLSELEGFSNKEIAEITGASIETVKIRLHRARQELKQKLSLQCDFYRNEQNEFACDRKNELIRLL